MSEPGELLRLSWTPLYRARVVTDVGFLADYARELRNTTPSAAASNRGGWQSGDLLAEFVEDARRKEVLDELATLARAFVEAYKRTDSPDRPVHPYAIEICNLWANVNGPGDWNAGHHHPGAHIAGTLYVQAPAGGGSLVLRPPYTFFDVAVDHVAEPSITPEPGMVLFFPADVWHDAEPNRAETDRISFAFNLRYRPRDQSGRTLL